MGRTQSVTSKKRIAVVRLSSRVQGDISLNNKSGRRRNEGRNGPIGK